MAPSTSQLAAQLRQMIFYHLDNDLLDDAVFLAGRLHALDPRNPDAVHILALCYYRHGQHKAVYDNARQLALAKGSHLGCSYVFAQACLKLERYSDGIAALEKARTVWDGRNHWNKHSETVRKHLPDSPAIYSLLGKLYHGNRDVKHAVECYAEALKLNPFLWDTFERLCETGTKIRPSSIFRMNADMIPASSTSAPDKSSTTVPAPALSNQQDIAPSGFDPFHTSSGRVVGNSIMNFGRAHSKSTVGKSSASVSGHISSLLATETPPSHAAEDTTSIFGEATAPMAVAGLEPPNAPLRRSRVVPTSRIAPASAMDPMSSARGKAKVASEDNHDMGTEAMHMHKRTASGNLPTAASLDTSFTTQRRSVRILNHMRPNSAKISSIASTAPVTSRDVKVATAAKGRSTSTVGRVVSGNRKPVEADSQLKSNRPHASTTEHIPTSQRQVQEDPRKDTETLQWLLDLFSKLGHGYFALSQYQCPVALKHLNSVPGQQKDTPWVLAQIAKAQYEQSNYLEAEKAFARVKKMAPSRAEDMEIYSTVLWQLKNDIELAFLAHELVAVERLSPQAWCTIGNSFSLQRDHDQALKCFRRATQLDPNFAYGYTLEGHEHVANEEYDKAQLAYRKSIAIDHRHYNGWYGLGKVYDKEGKYDMALTHYIRAANINPTNSILLCCVGGVYEKLRKPLAALQQYRTACDLAPSSSITRFKKARVLVQLQRPQEALEEFKLLKDMAPDEANVHFMLGRVYKALHDKPNAIRHFTEAMTLDPRAQQHIKEAMDNLDDDEDGDEDDEDEDAGEDDEEEDEDDDEEREDEEEEDLSS